MPPKHNSPFVLAAQALTYTVGTLSLESSLPSGICADLAEYEELILGAENWETVDWARSSD